MARIELILLDFDGTLADTRRANALAYKQALAEAGYRLDEEEYARRWFGMRCGEFLRSFGIADPEQIDRLRLRKIALYPSFFDTVRLNRPLWEFCQAFRAGGGRVWIVSTGQRDNIDHAIDWLGLREGLDGILCGADTQRPKPDPDCFLRAMEAEGVTPDRTLIFEDSEIGLEAARRSGAAYIRVEL